MFDDADQICRIVGIDGIRDVVRLTAGRLLAVASRQGHSYKAGHAAAWDRRRSERPSERNRRVVVVEVSGSALAAGGPGAGPGSAKKVDEAVAKAEIVKARHRGHSLSDQQDLQLEQRPRRLSSRRSDDKGMLARWLMLPRIYRHSWS